MKSVCVCVILSHAVLCGCDALLSGQQLQSSELVVSNFTSSQIIDIVIEWDNSGRSRTIAPKSTGEYLSVEPRSGVSIPGFCINDDGYGVPFTVSVRPAGASESESVSARYLQSCASRGVEWIYILQGPNGELLLEAWSGYGIELPIDQEKVPWVMGTTAALDSASGGARSSIGDNGIDGLSNRVRERRIDGRASERKASSGTAIPGLVARWIGPGDSLYVGISLSDGNAGLVLRQSGATKYSGYQWFNAQPDRDELLHHELVIGALAATAVGLKPARAAPARDGQRVATERRVRV